MLKSYLIFIFLLFIIDNIEARGYYERFQNQIKNCDYENCFECDVEFHVYDDGALEVNFKNSRGFEVAGFHGNVNRRIQFGEIGQINFDLRQSDTKNWKYLVKNAFVERYNQISYWIYIQKNGQQIFCNRLRTRIEGEPCPSTNTFGYCTALGKHKPKIEIFKPKGIRVTVNDTPGLQKVSFRANINQPIFRDDKGDYHFELQKKDGKWIHYIENIDLKLADQINFFLSVRENNKEIDYFKKRILVKKIEPSPFLKVNQNESVQNTLSNRCPPCNCPASSIAHATASANANVNVHNRQPITNVHNKQTTSATGRPHAIPPTAACNPSPSSDNLCNIVDLIGTITKLENAQAAIESLTEVIEQLKSQSQTNIKGLKLFYQMSKSPLPQLNPVDIIKSLIVDNLDMIDLENEIAQATFVDGGIIFEVKRNIDKMRILYRAMQMLANSKNKIIDPEASNNSNINTTPNISTTTKKNDNFDELANNVFNPSTTAQPSNSDIDESFWRNDESGIQLPTKRSNNLRMSG